MTTRLLLRLLRLAALLLTAALIGLIALIVPSADNGPYMTPFAILVEGLITVLVLIGFVGGLAEREAEGSEGSEQVGDG
jgi:hypothetical protein